MWFFIFIFVWWLFCATSTYCKLQNRNIMNIIKNTLSIIFHALFPTSIETKAVLRSSGWPECRKVLQYTKKVIGEEVTWHYFECPNSCLKTRPFETTVNSHYKYISKIITECAKITNVIQVEYIYLAPDTRSEKACIWDCYELNVIAKPDQIGLDRIFKKNEIRLYENLTTQPVVILRLCYTNVKQNQTSKTFTSFVDDINEWLKHPQ